MRKAGQLIAEYLREKKLSSNRESPIGMGAYGRVYPSNLEGYVIKEKHRPGEWTNYHDNSYTDEAGLQAAAAEMGIAPQVSSVETFRGGIGDRIEMQDIRKNFEMPPVSSQWPTGKNAIRINQQLGQLALKGIDLDDRHAGNVVYNKMTGRPMQLDFGRASRVEGEMQIDALTRATADGFAAAGLNDVAEIFRDTVYDLMAGGDFKEAMDVAKQGFSRLQKIKEPILS